MPRAAPPVPAREGAGWGRRRGLVEGAGNPPEGYPFCSGGPGQDSLDDKGSQRAGGVAGFVGAQAVRALGGAGGTSLMELSPWARAPQSPHMAAAVHLAASWKPWHRVQSRTSGRLTTILAGLDPKTRKGEGVALGRTTVKPLGILPGTTRGAKGHDFGRGLIDSGGVRAASRPHESALAGGRGRGLAAAAARWLAPASAAAPF